MLVPSGFASYDRRASDAHCRPRRYAVLLRSLVGAPPANPGAAVCYLITWCPWCC